MEVVYKVTGAVDSLEQLLAKLASRAEADAQARSAIDRHVVGENRTSYCSYYFVSATWQGSDCE